MKHTNALLLLVVAGCSDIGDIELDFTTDAVSITAHTDGTQTSVNICPGSDGLVDCREDGVFEVTIAGTTVIAEPRLLLGQLGAEFPFDGSNQVVTVTDRRGSATVTIPPPFAVFAPETASRSRGIPAVWNPADPDSTIGWGIDAACPSGGSFYLGAVEVDDDGAVTIPSSDFADLPHNEVCNVVITLERDRKGQVSAGMPEGSSITGTQRRNSQDITLQP